MPLKAHSLHMEFHGFFHRLLYLIASYPGSDAAGHIRRICGKTRAGLLYDYKIFHGRNPACFKMLFSVPGAMSSRG